MATAICFTVVLAHRGVEDTINCEIQRTENEFLLGGGESFEILYATHRLLEAGYEPVIAAPEVKSMNLVIHDFEPGWDTYVERKGYLVKSQISFDEVDPGEYKAVLFPGGPCSGVFT